MHTVRALTATAVLAVATLGAFALAPPADAAGGQIKCTAVTGTITSGLMLGGCSGNTGGGANFVAPGVFQVGGTITWVNGKTTTLSMTFRERETDPTETLSCPARTIELESVGTVTADTTGSAPVGGAAKSEMCIRNRTGAVTLEPGTAIKLK
jgi:hypothetical protein